MNQIHYLTSENEYENIKKILSESSDTFIAELDGAKCHNNWKSFYKLAETAFGIVSFPEDNIDGLADSLMDVFWIKQTKSRFISEEQPPISSWVLRDPLEVQILAWAFRLFPMA